MLILYWLFWISVGLISYTYFGFPILLALKAIILPKKIRGGRQLPSVSVIVAAHNEQNFIVQKLDNILSICYPKAHLEVIVASDGSTDNTNELVASYEAEEVKLLALPRQGKNRTLNAAVSISRGDILVFTDADTMMEKDSLLHLVSPFSDPSIGAVGGDYQYAVSGKNKGESSYWNYDRLLKKLQTLSGSMTSATGQIFAIRREYFTPIPDKLVDDFYTSVQAPANHARLIFEPRAIGYGPIAESTEAEFERKVRVITGGLRSVWRMRKLLNPFRYGFYAIQLFTHKLLRRLLVIPMLIAGISSLFLITRGPIYQLAAVVQVGIHGVAGAAYLLRNTKLGRTKLLSLPLFFDLVNAASLVAFINLIFGTGRDLWSPQRATARTSDPNSANYAPGRYTELRQTSFSAINLSQSDMSAPPDKLH